MYFFASRHALKAFLNESICAAVALCTLCVYCCAWASLCRARDRPATAPVAAPIAAPLPASPAMAPNSAPPAAPRAAPLTPAPALALAACCCAAGRLFLGLLGRLERVHARVLDRPLVARRLVLGLDRRGLARAGENGDPDGGGQGLLRRRLRLRARRHLRNEEYRDRGDEKLLHGDLLFVRERRARAEERDRLAVPRHGDRQRAGALGDDQTEGSALLDALDEDRGRSLSRACA